MDTFCNDVIPTADNQVGMGRARTAYWMLIAKPDEKRPLGRHGHKCENNNKIDLKKYILWKWGRVSYCHIDSFLGKARNMRTQQ
jgi:hypothetical protein